jgi:hypothetical protein
MSSAKPADVIATLFFVMTFLGVGAAAFEGHVNYPAWGRISDQSFTSYHQAVTARIGVLIVPLALSTLLNALLLWRRPPSMPLWAVWSMLALQIVAWISSVMIQVPIQRELSAAGYSSELMERLISTDLLYRKLPGYLRSAIAGWTLYRIVRDAGTMERANNTDRPTMD